MTSAAAGASPRGPWDTGVPGVIHYFGEDSGRCGYCGSSDGSVTSGAWAFSLTPHQYQALIDRGWRRSGCYVYKPTVERTCCPQYTIRLPCLAFLPDKQQRRVLRKFARAVNALADGPDVQDGPKREGIGRRGGAVEIPAKDARGGGASGSGGGAVEVIDDGPIGPGDGRGDGTGDGGAEFLAEVLTRAVSGLVSSGVVAAEAAASARVKVSEPSAVARGRLGPAVAFCSPLPFALAKEEASRTGEKVKDGAERIAHALAASANDALATSEAPRPLRLSASAAAGFVNFVRPDSRSDAVDTENPSAGADATRRGGRKKQRADKTPTGARENEAGKTLARGGRPGKEEQSLPQEGRWSAGGRLLGALGERMAAGDWEGEGWRSVFEGGAGRARDGKGPGFEIRMAPSAFDDEEYRLYCKYQIAVHGDDPRDLNPRRYSKFLVDSPFPPAQPGVDPEAPECGYGAFHMQYRLDGRLVAVGVVDVLPRCLSSKYFFYDPDMRHLALGRLGALMEIQWVLDHCVAMGRDCGLQYYYMGYYIHDCPKMLYKAQYAPSDLLCPASFQWYPAAACQPLLGRSKYVPFCEHEGGDEGEEVRAQGDGGGGGNSARGGRERESGAAEGSKQGGGEEEGEGGRVLRRHMGAGDEVWAMEGWVGSARDGMVIGTGMGATESALYLALCMKLVDVACGVVAVREEARRMLAMLAAQVGSMGVGDEVRALRAHVAEVHATVGEVSSLMGPVGRCVAVFLDKALHLGVAARVIEGAVGKAG